MVVAQCRCSRRVVQIGLRVTLALANPVSLSCSTPRQGPKVKRQEQPREKANHNQVSTRNTNKHTSPSLCLSINILIIKYLFACNNIHNYASLSSMIRCLDPVVRVHQPPQLQVLHLPTQAGIAESLI
jgi:hypothetical protein